MNTLWGEPATTSPWRPAASYQLANALGGYLSLGMTDMFSVRRCLLGAAVVALSARGSALRAQAAPRSAPLADCEFSGKPRSSLAWESGQAQGSGPATRVERDAVVGRVIAVRTGDPIGQAYVRLDPGGHFARSDSSGRFAFPPLPQGRYRVTVYAGIGGGSVSDSVMLGFDGLRLVAAIATHTGDIGCSPPERKPPNDR